MDAEDERAGVGHRADDVRRSCCRFDRTEQRVGDAAAGRDRARDAAVRAERELEIDAAAYRAAQCLRRVFERAARVEADERLKIEEVTEGVSAVDGVDGE